MSHLHIIRKQKKRKRKEEGVEPRGNAPPLVPPFGGG